MGGSLFQHYAERLSLLKQGKRRVRRVEEIVIPEIESLKPIIAKRVFEEMKIGGVRGSKQDLQAMHSKRTIQIVC